MINVPHQSVPLIRYPVLCGATEDVARGREPCQMGWYDFVSQHMGTQKSVLDVGAGMGAGLTVMHNAGHFAIGLEKDARLLGQHPMMIINSLLLCPSRMFDVVTCMDVIEHVVDDVLFLLQLLTVARSRVYVSTPNYTRSKAANHHHARELTIPQFLRHYRPDELWVGSPDGWTHRTLLTRAFSDHGLPYGKHFTISCGRHQGSVMAFDHISDDLSFTDTTVDGLEWPHMLGVWHHTSVTSPADHLST